MPACVSSLSSLSNLPQHRIVSLCIAFLSFLLPTPSHPDSIQLLFRLPRTIDACACARGRASGLVGQRQHRTSTQVNPSIHPSNQHPKSNPSPGKPASRRLELRSIPFSRSPSTAHRFNRWPINPPFSSGPPPPFLPYNQPSVGYPHPPTTPFVFISTSCVRGRLSTVKISYALNIHRARGLQP